VADGYFVPAVPALASFTKGGDGNFSLCEGGDMIASPFGKGRARGISMGTKGVR